jgi:hypothetical protein
MAKWRLFLERDSSLGYAMVAPAVLILMLFIAYPFILGIRRASASGWSVRNQSLWGCKISFAMRIARFLPVRSEHLHLYRCGDGPQGSVRDGAGAGAEHTFRGKGLVRAAFLLPWIIPTVLSTLAWLWMFDATFSVLNWFLRYFGLVQRGISWLGDPVLAMISIIVVNAWRGIPFFAISLLAGLQTISQDLEPRPLMAPAVNFRHHAADGSRLLRALFSIIWTLRFQLVRADARRSATHHVATGIKWRRVGSSRSSDLTMFHSGGRRGHPADVSAKEILTQRLSNAYCCFICRCGSSLS